jgi:hypothetical protein
VVKEVRTFDTTTASLMALSEWLAENKCTHVASKALKNFTSASGWVSTLVSFTTLPVASTMHTLESSKETSIAA